VVKEIVSRVRGQGSGVREEGITDTGLRSSVSGQAVTFVGVFVNAPLETVAHLLDFCQLDAAQLHGEESPEFVRYFQGRAFKALRPKSLEEAEALIQKYLPCSPAPRLPCLLLDAYHPTLYGGTGYVTDWTMAASLARRYPLMLAGSLTPENVVAAVRLVQPWGVDVSSGVEKEKGQKDHEKVRAFVEAAKGVKRKA
jgi:phosphoribosylanthranilate isomerase